MLGKSGSLAVADGAVFPIQAVRDEFPALSIADAGRRRVYLDNPAGTQVPRAVADAVRTCMFESNANLGGYFTTSVAAGEVLDRARAAMALFLNAASEREIVVGPSMTTLTFAISRGLERTLGRDDEIVVTRMDHDGNVAPWLEMARDCGAAVRWVDFDHRTWTVSPDALASAMSRKTRLVALNYASNLTGAINDVAALCRLARDYGALSYVDAVQYAPHGAIDVAALGCDFLTCSSYKFFGPHLAVLWGREPLLDATYAYKVRPQPDRTPWKFETGTPQIELFAGLAATVEYFERLGALCGSTAGGRAAIVAAFKAASAWESDLARSLIAGLQRLGVTMYGPAETAARVPTVSFRHPRRAPDDVARALAARGIFVWSGHNFALEVVRSLGIDESEGVVRIGLAHYNDAGEVAAVLEALC